jgi:retron-type reverse transcriptase
VRLIQKWLNAGVLEKGVRTFPEAGSPQGGSASPLLANIYLHYVFDLWVYAWRKKRAHGDVIVVRYADDIVVSGRRCAEVRGISRLDNLARSSSCLRFVSGLAAMPARLGAGVAR